MPVKHLHKHPKKVYMDIKNFISLLTPKGILFYTFPWNYNLYLETIAVKNKFNFISKVILKRDNGRWKQIPFENYLQCGSNKRDLVFFIGVIKK